MGSLGAASKQASPQTYPTSVPQIMQRQQAAQPSRFSASAKQNQMNPGRPIYSDFEENRKNQLQTSQRAPPTVSDLADKGDRKGNGERITSGKSEETQAPVAKVDVQAKMEAGKKVKPENDVRIQANIPAKIFPEETKAAKPAYQSLIMSQGAIEAKDHERKLKALTESIPRPAESASKPTPKSTMDTTSSSIHHEDSSQSIPTSLKPSVPALPFTKPPSTAVTQPPSSRKHQDFSTTGQAAMGGNIEEQRVMGLRNFGNVCFMNAIIQCLAFTPGMQEALQGDANTAAKTGGQLVKAVKELLTDMKQGRQTALNVMKIKSVISTVAAQFRDYEQHDAQEFLRFLLDALHEELNKGNKSAQPQKLTRTLEGTQKLENLAELWWNTSLLRDNSGLTDLFQGQLVHILTCSKCHNSTYTFEVFLDLSLPIPVTNRGRSTGCSLQQCFEEFTSEKAIEGVKCKHCGPQVCMGRMMVQRFPRVLVLHLKRFAMNMHSEGKINAPVTCPSAKLDLSRYSLSAGMSRYDLYGIAHHMGDTDYGHYYAY